MPSNTSGNPNNSANKPNGTVNKLSPGIKNVSSPLRINGNNNPRANSKNGSPPNNALSRPTNNPFNTAGIKLNNKLLIRLRGKRINPNNNSVRSVLIPERIAKFNHLSGFKNVITPRNGSKNKNDNPATKSGNAKSLNKSKRTFNGNSKMFRRLIKRLNKPIRLRANKMMSRNGIKFGNNNRSKASNGKPRPNSPSPIKFNSPNAPNNNASGNPRASNRPIPLINSGNTTRLLNPLSNNAGIPIKLNSVNVLNSTNGNDNRAIMMSEIIPAPIANNTEISGLMNSQYGIDSNNPSNVKPLMSIAKSLSGNRIKKLRNDKPAIKRFNRARSGPTRGTSNEIGANSKLATPANIEIPVATPRTRLINPMMN